MTGNTVSVGTEQYITKPLSSRCHEDVVTQRPIFRFGLNAQKTDFRFKPEYKYIICVLFASISNPIPLISALINFSMNASDCI